VAANEKVHDKPGAPVTIGTMTVVNLVDTVRSEEEKEPSEEQGKHTEGR